MQSTRPCMPPPAPPLHVEDSERGPDGEPPRHCLVSAATRAELAGYGAKRISQSKCKARRGRVKQRSSGCQLAAPKAGAAPAHPADSTPRPACCRTAPLLPCPSQEIFDLTPFYLKDLPFRWEQRGGGFAGKARGSGGGPPAGRLLAGLQPFLSSPSLPRPQPAPSGLAMCVPLSLRLPPACPACPLLQMFLLRDIKGVVARRYGGDWRKVLAARQRMENIMQEFNDRCGGPPRLRPAGALLAARCAARCPVTASSWLGAGLALAAPPLHGMPKPSAAATAAAAVPRRYEAERVARRQALLGELQRRGYSADAAAALLTSAWAGIYLWWAGGLVGSGLGRPHSCLHVTSASGRARRAAPAPPAAPPATLPCRPPASTF